MASKLTTNEAKLAHAAQRGVGVLAALFLLGMAVNLIGLPDETSGGAKIASGIFLFLHVLLAIGLAAGTFMAVRVARKIGGELFKLTRFAAAGVGVTIIAGVLTMATGSNWWSYLMAVGFVASLLLYGVLFVRVRSRE